MTTFFVVNMQNITPIFSLFRLGLLKNLLNKKKYVYVLQTNHFFVKMKSIIDVKTDVYTYTDVCMIVLFKILSTTR